MLAWATAGAIGDLHAAADGLHACIGLAMPGRTIGPWSQKDRSAGGVRDQTGPNNALVSAGSAVDRLTMDNSGQERTPGCRRSRRSLALQPPDLWWRRWALWSSNLPTMGQPIFPDRAGEARGDARAD